MTLRVARRFRGGRCFSGSGSKDPREFYVCSLDDKRMARTINPKINLHGASGMTSNGHR